MSSGVWAPLLPAAMVGTERHAGHWPAWPGDVGAAVADAADAAPEPASRLLRAAAVLAACSHAGAQGLAWSGTLPAPAADESRPMLPEGPLGGLVSWTMHHGPARLQHRVVAVLARSGHRLAPALLPQALELARRSLALRAVLSPVLGERGVWLAAQREEWQFAAGVAADAPDLRRWTDGSLDQRRDFLRRERRENPVAARERLAATLEELPAKERADLVAVLAEGLGRDDEVLLDRLRSDRSREVRQVAAELLLRLPESAFVARAIARVEPLLRHERVLLRKRWSIEPPLAVDEGWKADLPDMTRPRHETLGDRAWWLYQLVRQVPLAWWPQHTGLSVAELLAWAQEGDWHEALVRGWRDLLYADPDTAWCEALLERWPAKVLRDDSATVLAMLPLARRERHWERALEGGTVPLHLVVHQVLAACPADETLSASLSTQLARRLGERVAGRTLAEDHVLRSSLVDLCCVLHADALPVLLRIERQPDDPPSLTDILHTAAQVVAVRRALLALDPD